MGLTRPIEFSSGGGKGSRQLCLILQTGEGVRELDVEVPRRAGAGVPPLPVLLGTGGGFQQPQLPLGTGDARSPRSHLETRSHQISIGLCLQIAL